MNSSSYEIKWKRGLNCASYKEIISEPFGTIWEIATKAGLNSITLERVNNLGIDDKNGFDWQKDKEEPTLNQLRGPLAFEFSPLPLFSPIT